MSTTTPLVDPADRAQQSRRQWLTRIPLSKIGFFPGNRGGQGICPHHVHEVTSDFMANKTKVTRYEDVDLVKIPENRRVEVLKVNESMCENEPLLPRFDKDIEYVCASKTSKTHVVHGQKLVKEGKKKLYNNLGKQGITIKLRVDDEEGKLLQGPCASSLMRGSLLTRRPWSQCPARTT